MQTNNIYINKEIQNIALKVTMAIAIVLVAHSVLLAVSAKTIKKLNLDKLQVTFLESTLITLFIVAGIWFLISRFDKGSTNSIGLNKLPKAIASFSFGVGLLLVPLFLSLIVTELAGWAEIKVNWQGARGDLILLGMLSVFITDAFPEELVFRGYIFSQLLNKYSTWKSAIVTTLLFVMFPIILFPIKALLGPDLTTGFVNNISLGYLGYMLLFGAFAMYLRILTKSIWAGIGFHLMFVYMNQLIGLNDFNLIQFSSFTNELNVQLTFGIFLILSFILLFTYPKIKGAKLRKLSPTESLS